jgi:hypothetical protein
MVSPPQKGCYSGAFLELIRLLKQAWIWTWVLTSLMSWTLRLVPEPFQVSLCNWNLLPQLARREAPFPGSAQSGGAWQGQPCQPVTRGWKHHPPNPGWAARYVAGGLRQRLRGRQNFQEASSFIKPTAAQQTQVQRLNPKNKGSFPYIPFKSGYRNGGWVQLVPYIITCYFIGCFNLWGKVTLLWSPGNIPQLWFSYSTHYSLFPLPAFLPHNFKANILYHFQDFFSFADL